MSKYTTGEMAGLCGISVRTVQYYDSRGILIPTQLSEGGRRLYSEEDLKRLKIICFLRDMGFSINSISELLEQSESTEVISILLKQQQQALKEEISERQRKLDMLEGMIRELKTIKHFSVESIGDIAYIMENKKKLRRVHGLMIAVGIPMDIIEIGTLIFWIKTGIWQPFALGMCVVAALAVWISSYYVKHTAYICPQCHTVFKPGFKESLFARHTPKTRKLKCTSCGFDGFCVETYYDASKAPEPLSH